MAFKFYNIGKANEEITRLETALAAKPAATAGPEAGQLADAMASNVEISAQLAQANTDLAAAKASASALTGQLETAQGQVNTIGGAVKAACVALKIESAATATTAEMVALLQTSLPTLSSRKALDITAAAGAPAAPSVAASATAGKSELKGMARILAAGKADLTAAGYVPKIK